MEFIYLPFGNPEYSANLPVFANTKLHMCFTSKTSTFVERSSFGKQGPDRLKFRFIDATFHAFGSHRVQVFDDCTIQSTKNLVVVIESFWILIFGKRLSRPLL